MTSPPWSSCVSETETVDCLETESDKQSEETEPQINSDQSVAKSARSSKKKFRTYRQQTLEQCVEKMKKFSSKNIENLLK